MKTNIEDIRAEFVTQWGTFGSNWGISRSMAQIHALLMVAPKPLSTDDVMESLGASRGNVHSNIKELISWNLVRPVLKRGERKEYFEAEKDAWKIFCHICRKRKSQEIDPVVETLRKVIQETEGIKDAETKAFRKQIKELHGFTKLSADIMDRASRSEESTLVSWALRFLKFKG